MRHLALSALLAGAALAVLSAASASATPFDSTAYADSVVNYTPGIIGDNPTVAHRGAFNALGVEDYDGHDRCRSQASCSFASLGHGGSITLQFTNNKLTGSGNADFDLWIYEVGGDIESTFVWISKDGNTWFDVGSVSGSTAGIDIDAFGFGVDDLFAFVRLVDDTQDGIRSEDKTPGADIDAVAALSTVFTPIPEPGALALVGAGLAWLGGRARRRSARGRAA